MGWDPGGGVQRGGGWGGVVRAGQPLPVPPADLRDSTLRDGGAEQRWFKKEIIIIIAIIFFYKIVFLKKKSNKNPRGRFSLSLPLRLMEKPLKPPTG